jgi:hypothetical protein
MINLHDYLAKNTNWQQLWADDDKGFVIQSTDSSKLPYEVIIASRSGLHDDGVMQVPTYCKDLSQAMDYWNGAINQHLASK